MRPSLICKCPAKAPVARLGLRRFDRRRRAARPRARGGFRAGFGKKTSSICATQDPDFYAKNCGLGCGIAELFPIYRPLSHEQLCVLKRWLRTIASRNAL